MSAPSRSVSQRAMRGCPPKAASCPLVPLLWAHWSYTHTWRASAPQPVPLAMWISVCMHSRTPCAAQRAEAFAKLSLLAHPPMPADELAQTPRASSWTQPCKCAHGTWDTAALGGGGNGGTKGQGDGAGTAGGGGGTLGGRLLVSSAQHRTACCAVAFVSHSGAAGLPPRAVTEPFCAQPPEAHTICASKPQPVPLAMCSSESVHRRTWCCRQWADASLAVAVAKHGPSPMAELAHTPRDGS